MRSTRPQSRPTSAARRPASGFSLIELLIVIAIIAVLSTIVIQVIGTATTRAKVEATRSTLAKVHRLLEERRQALGRRKLTREIAYIKQVHGVTRTDQARVLAVKEAMKTQFPQYAADLNGPDREPNTADDSPIKSVLAKFLAAGRYIPANHTPVTESSELLYLALTEGPELGSGSGAIDFDEDELRDTDKDGLLEFVDAWGNPLRFYRWPTRLIRPGGPGSTALPGAVELLIRTATPALLSTDPDDPDRFFSAWMQSPAGTAAGGEAVFHTHSTWHIPLVISAGPDGELGLFEPVDLANFGQLAQPLPAVLSNPIASTLIDNLSNRNLAAD